MTTKIFLPEFRSQPVGEMFIGVYRYFLNDDWRWITRKGGDRKLFPSADAAETAARSILVHNLNPHIYSQVETEAADPLHEFVQDWFKRQGCVGPIIRNKRSGKRVIVEQRRRR